MAQFFDGLKAESSLGEFYTLPKFSTVSHNASFLILQLFADNQYPKNMLKPWYYFNAVYVYAKTLVCIIRMRIFSRFVSADKVEVN
jgi:hypothetical protein